MSDRTPRPVCRRCVQPVHPEDAHPENPAQHWHCYEIGQRKAAERQKREREDLFAKHGEELLAVCEAVVGYEAGDQDYAEILAAAQRVAAKFGKPTEDQHGEEG